ncbi:MAG TPA: Zn-ribbon domain-containing OB-fold protein [Candidatus Polarisedimenticolia bacterium]|nr:Zn-ribbon domain-containing OB-fold protein [Candidatus Polarisedimenticolia bacterium]
MELPRYHRMRRTLYRLEGSACGACGGRFFPPRAVCPACKKGDLAPHRFSGRGTLYSYTRVTQPPRGFASVAPYDVGMVRLEEGPLISAQLTDTEGIELTIDMPVEMVTRTLRDSAEHGFIVYGYKFRPLLRELRPRP